MERPISSALPSSACARLMRIKRLTAGAQYLPRSPAFLNMGSAVTDDHKLRNSLEALTNLVYLARLNVSEPRAASTYLELADEHMKLIAGSQIMGAKGFDS